MKKLFLTLTLAIVSLAIFAQEDFTRFVNTMNGYTDGYANDVVAEMYQHHYGVPQNTLFDLFGGAGSNWGNVALGIEMSRILGIPLPDIFDGYREGMSNGEGWGVMAKRYGIKPGSPEFHRMKRMMRRSGSMWGGIFRDYGKSKDPKIARRGGFMLDEGMIKGNNGNGKGNSMLKNNDKGNGNKVNSSNKGNRGKANKGKGGNK